MKKPAKAWFTKIPGCPSEKRYVKNPPIVVTKNTTRQNLSSFLDKIPARRAVSTINVIIGKVNRRPRYSIKLLVCIIPKKFQDFAGKIVVDKATTGISRWSNLPIIKLCIKLTICNESLPNAPISFSAGLKMKTRSKGDNKIKARFMEIIRSTFE